jgi:uncharacterized protein (TIGR03000 family)
MSKRIFALASLAILGCLAVSGTSYAQSSRQGTYLYQDSPRWYSAPSSAGAFYPSTSVESSRAFYPGAVDPDKVLIEVNVPADAKIMFQGAKTNQTGAVRRFVSPSIAAGYRYSYTVQANWMENGKEVSQNRSIAVQPGEVVHVTFTRDGVQVR